MSKSVRLLSWVALLAVVFCSSLPAAPAKKPAAKKAVAKAAPAKKAVATKAAPAKKPCAKRCGCKKK